MATKAYLLIETAVGKTRDVATTLTGLPGIASVDVVTGPYDIIAVVSGEDMTVVGDLVTGHIHTVTGVVRTVTCVAVTSS
ncbi:MAG: Lrp/AsnC ligand binding domain-containing protein [Chloroflexi bacterium]|jgi:DNA-binding Lrp family transcriptional regulator|nr:Lrp/AsnC ligand binding domain-containing protein [Chloroflexota bacterium]